MNTPRKKFRKKSTLENYDTDEIIYSAEEAEFLGYDHPDFHEKEEDDEEDGDNEENFEDEDFEEEESDNTSKRKRKSKKTDPSLDKSSKKSGTSKEKYYVNPQEFDDEIVNYYKTGNMSDNLAMMISKIANKLSFAPNFIRYTYREEMVGDGIIRMFKALTTKKYDHAKGSNPFSYFTRIAFNAFRNRIKKEKHLRDTHEKYQNELAIFSEGYNIITKNSQQRITKNKENY